jgi:hypothetical protein
MKGTIRIFATFMLTAVFLLVAVFPAGAATTTTPVTLYHCVDNLVVLEERVGGQVYHVIGYQEGRMISDNPMVTMHYRVDISSKYNDPTGMVTGSAVLSTPDADGGGWSGRGYFRIDGMGANPFTANMVLHGTGDFEGYELHLVSGVPIPPEEWPLECAGSLAADLWEGYILNPAGK